MVREGLHLVRELLLGEGGECELLASPVHTTDLSTDRVTMTEELMVCSAAEVRPAPGPNLLAPQIQREALAKVSRWLRAGCPAWAARAVRKHQLASLLRCEVQLALVSSALARTLTLGPVDWTHDPAILGLELETAFSLEHRVEVGLHCTNQSLIMLLTCSDVQGRCKFPAGPATGEGLGLQAGGRGSAGGSNPPPGPRHQAAAQAHHPRQAVCTSHKP